MAKTNPKFGTPASFLYAGIILLAAIWLLANGFRTLRWQNMKKDICTEQLTAEVTGYEQIRHSNSKGGHYINKYPQYSFTYNGQTYQVTSEFKMETRKNEFQKGTRLPIFIDPENPNIFFVPAENGGKIYMGYMFVGGTVMMILGLWILFESIAHAGHPIGT